MKREGERTRRRREVLYPITCPSCGEILTWTACRSAEAWCQRCRRWVRISPGGTPNGKIYPPG